MSACVGLQTSTVIWQSFVRVMWETDLNRHILQNRFDELRRRNRQIDMTRGKPAPDPYLRAAAAVGADPRRCLAFEDSPSGIASALAAGATVVGIATALSREAILAAGAHHAIGTFEDPQLAALIA